MLGGAVTVLLLVHFVASLILPPQPSRLSRFLNTYPWVGVKKNPFGRHWSAIASIKNTREMLIEGYSKYSLRRTPFVLAQCSVDPLLVVSAGQLEELLRQPEAKVNFGAANLDIPPVRHTLGPEFSTGPHIDLVRTEFTRRLPTIIEDMSAEIVLALEESWPANAQGWMAVKAKPTCMAIVRRATNRILCGTTLCRNSSFLHGMHMYFASIIQAAGVITLCPVALHFVVVPILQWRLRRWQKLCVQQTAPIIRQRLATILPGTIGSGKEEPNDALQWLLREGVRRTQTHPEDLKPELITLRLLVWNILSIHTMSMAIVTTLLDLCDSPNSLEYIGGLREECTRVLAEHGGVWTKEALGKLVRVDSAIRESMRVSPLADVAVKRTITEPHGITLSDGLHIPHGICVAAPVYCYHLDPNFYPDRPDTYDAFRFSRPVEEAGRTGGSKDSATQQEASKPKSLSITATKVEFLPFGLGKHACPGRFFAAQELKLLLAHILLNYEVELRSRPPNMRTAQSNVPGDDAELFIKLRNGRAQRSDGVQVPI